MIRSVSRVLINMAPASRAGSSTRRRPVRRSTASLNCSRLKGRGTRSSTWCGAGDIDIASSPQGWDEFLTLAKVVLKSAQPGLRLVPLHDQRAGDSHEPGRVWQGAESSAAAR